MEQYQVRPRRLPAYAASLACLLCGLLLFLAPLLGLRRYGALVQLTGLFFLVASLLLTNRYLLTNYIYELDSAPNALSALPKLNIYASRGHNFGHQFYCLPFEKTYSIRLVKGKKSKLKAVNACGSMFPKQIYLVEYDCDGTRNGVYIECDETFAKRIESFIAQYGCREESDFQEKE